MVGLKQRVEQECAAHGVKIVFDQVRIAVGSTDINIGPKSTDKIRFLGCTIGVRFNPAELIEVGASATGKDVNSSSGRVKSPAVGKVPILDGGQEIAQPPERPIFAWRIELIPKDQRSLAL